jgi:anaerobic ribonucleoside-triphosphate reductase activating protein
MKLPLGALEITLNDDPTLETISLTIYVQGCIRKCIGCHNPEFQEFNENNLIDIEDLKDIIKEKCSSLCTSVCFCGGDFLPKFAEQLEVLVDYCNELNVRTILYTGERYQDIPGETRNKIDIIITDPYDINLATDKFPASENQRVWMNTMRVNPDTLAINKKQKEKE